MTVDLFWLHHHDIKFKFIVLNGRKKYVGLFSLRHHDVTKEKKSIELFSLRHHDVTKEKILFGCFRYITMT
jgi:hypothetical protein